MKQVYEQEVLIQMNQNKKRKPADHELQFGRIFTDHMFIMDYTEGAGWHDPRIIPYQALAIDPSCVILHYAQTVFEGMKAYRTDDNNILLFRPDRNFRRLNRSNERMVIPPIDEELALEMLRQLVLIDQDWVPSSPGTSLYIRPFIIATQPYLGVAPSAEYKFMIIMSPVGAYYKEGINPVKILIEDEYSRTVKGGTGEAKTGGNYAASLKAQDKSGKLGYSQVLWLDGREHKYIEEVGSMNIFFKIDDTVVTPELTGSILPGITRDSVIHLLKSWGMTVEERKITIDEVYQAYAEGKLEEAFGTGTAAVISPVGEFSWKSQVIKLGDGKTGPLSQKIYDTLTGIQYGKLPDQFGWMMQVK